MKEIKFKGKLLFEKKTIAQLDENQLKSVKGGRLNELLSSPGTYSCWTCTCSHGCHTHGC